ncbi:methylthioadenosine phosphorylase [Alkalispirillum mobile]|uniref:Probable S-methyl-5'-thioinosine phosphorylase n=1 Tax=Alkalispirillum mobile TaxID=85925 RepID=A0A498C838_9GAMM|nr:S-methyl-5'-thioinosine phosphorylase [Alkalispirillum mobile]RLK50296.1 methylthioadenosine phosphorylase [Alkalispirillum mobile]
MTLAIIGGTGLTRLDGLEITRREVVRTPFGEPSGPVIHGVLQGREVMFLARHGYAHTIPPHQINYRANIWAMRHLGVRRVIAVAAVGGLADEMEPGRLVFPDQIIDYTYGRRHTFFEQDLTDVVHIDFTYPYEQTLRDALISAADAAGLDAVPWGTYGATQGPRLETAAEVRRLARDGCHVVGMTGMPEAALAREAGLAYATCAAVANWAAGIGGRTVTMEEIDANLVKGMERVRSLLAKAVPQL